MAKFCGKCGSKIDENTGLCPKCNNFVSKNLEQNQSLNKPNTQNTLESSHKQIKSKKKDNFQNERKKESKKTVAAQPKKITRKEKKERKKASKKARNTAMTLGQKIKLFFIKLLAILLMLIILLAGVIGTLVYFDVVDLPAINNLFILMGIKQEELSDKDDKIPPESYEVPAPDADAYYAENSKILSEIKVNESSKVTTETETINILNNRGFQDYPIITEYSMDGEYSDAVEISTASSTKHPSYQTFYMSKSGDVWTIFVINGVVMANPVTYNLQSQRSAQLIISESDSVTSYDSTTNKFYETIPNESELIVKKVSKIDAETLESLTIGGIDKL